MESSEDSEEVCRKIGMTHSLTVLHLLSASLLQYIFIAIQHAITAE